MLSADRDLQLNRTINIWMSGVMLNYRKSFDTSQKEGCL